MKRLISAELWLDNISGIVDITVDYRPDGDTCWHQWHRFKICEQAALSGTDGDQYPVIQCGPGYRATITLPEPPVYSDNSMARPSNIGYQFQPRMTIKGYCRVRGFLLHATPFERKLYENIIA